MEMRIKLEKRGRNSAAIKELNLDNCRSTHIVGLTDEFCNLKSLSLINVGLETLEGFPRLPNLKQLELSDNRISGGLSWLHGSPNLICLNLSGNEIKDIETLKPLEDFKKLRNLDLFNCEITNVENYRDEVFRLISSLKYLDGYNREEEERPDDSDYDDENKNYRDEVFRLISSLGYLDGYNREDEERLGVSGSDYDDENNEDHVDEEDLDEDDVDDIDVDEEDDDIDIEFETEESSEDSDFFIDEDDDDSFFGEDSDVAFSLIQDYKKVYLEGTNRDLILKVGDKEFPVHRDILMARSDVFKSMLSHEMKEKESGVIDIPDCDPATMEQFLLYIYAGSVERFDDNIVFELYYMADKYNVVNLKKTCSIALFYSLSPTCACKVLEIALKHNDERLLKRVTDYFRNNAEAISATDEWQSFKKDNPTVVNKLFKKSFKGTEKILNSHS